MNQKLQDFSHEKSDYERPNLNRRTVTLPNFDTEVNPGSGSLPNEVTPAQQVVLELPSLRARRGAFTLAMTGLTIGFLLIAMNSPWSKEFLAPGPLSSPHAQLLAGRGVERCSACHGAADESFAAWLSGHQGATAQSELCMKCHENTLDAAFAMKPHGISMEQLAHFSQKTVEGSIAANLASMTGLSHRNEVACSVCHQEHHGNVSLSQLTDQQCQSCHSQTFHSFETDHPEFNQWPQINRQNIAFDHGTHLNKHFKNANTEFNCNLCHVDDSSQKVKRMASFEQACGSCHAQQIADSGQAGWTLFELPRLDMAAIEEAKLNVGNWPASATSDFDGDLPPMMRMMLAGDPDLQKVMSQLDEDFSFGDIDIDDADSIELAVELVWGIKRLMQELSETGQAAIDRRLSIVMGERYSREISHQLIRGLNPEIFAATAKRWLPNIEEDIRQHQSQRMSFKRRAVEMKLAAYVRPARPVKPSQELLAENPLSREAFTKTADPAANGGQTAIAGDSAKEGYEQTDSSAGAEIPAANTESSELLAINPLKGSSGTSAPAASNPPTKNPAATHRRQQMPVTVSPPKELSLLPEVAGVAMKFGWYRNDRLLKIGYRPKDHADAVVKSWSDCVSRIADADRNPASSALFEQVNSTISAGACRSCHTVNRTDDNVFEFAWLADRRDGIRSSFTKFSHRPHLTQWSIRECATCHRMNESVSLVGTFESCDASEGKSNFHPIVKADCVSCHQKGRTESGCMQCHNYHVGKH